MVRKLCAGDGVIPAINIEANPLTAKDIKAIVNVYWILQLIFPCGCHGFSRSNLSHQRHSIVFVWAVKGSCKSKLSCKWQAQFFHFVEAMHLAQKDLKRAQEILVDTKADEISLPSIWFSPGKVGFADLGRKACK